MRLSLRDLAMNLAELRRLASARYIPKPYPAGTGFILMNIALLQKD